MAMFAEVVVTVRCTVDPAMGWNALLRTCMVKLCRARSGTQTGRGR
jgi:hypothetical protein